MKGLSEGIETKEIAGDKDVTLGERGKPKMEQASSSQPSKFQKLYNEPYNGDQKPFYETAVAVPVELEQLDEQINSMIGPTDTPAIRGGMMVTCTMCDRKKGYRADVIRHIEANHITGISHSCDMCGKTARSRHALSIHKIRKHPN